MEHSSIHFHERLKKSNLPFERSMRCVFLVWPKQDGSDRGSRDYHVTCQFPTRLAGVGWVSICLQITHLLLYWIKCIACLVYILTHRWGSVIYIIITKNIRYLLWNRGFWCSLNNTYPLFLTLCIRCTNHLCDSCDLTDVNPHFIPSLLRMIQNVDLLWRHRYKSRPLAIVTS